MQVNSNFHKTLLPDLHGSYRKCLLNTRNFNFATIKEKRQGSSEKGEREKRSEKKRHWEKGPGTLV